MEICVLYSFAFHGLFYVIGIENELKVYLYEITVFNMSFSTHPFSLCRLIILVRSCTALKTQYIWFSSVFFS